MRNVGEFNVQAIIIGVSALGIMIVLARTRLANLSSLIALVLPTILVLLLGWEGVQQVADVSPIPRGFPELTFPDVTLISPSLLLAAFSVAVVIAVQGAGVSKSYENPDGTPVSASRDMLAQGAGNLAAGLFSGIPAGGAVGQTALRLVAQAAPELVSLPGIGTDNAATLLIVAGDNPQRLGSEASFASLCGVAPIEASSGKVVRHRLNRGGNREANRALYMICLARMRRDRRTQEYVARRTAEGKSKREIIRCLKRYVAREVYRVLIHSVSDSSAT